MTENLLQKLEEKMMLLLSEVESLRRENGSLKDANASLISERENHSKKLQDLISLFDAVNVSDSTAHSSNIAAMKPVLVQQA